MVTNLTVKNLTIQIRLKNVCNTFHFAPDRLAEVIQEDDIVTIRYEFNADTILKIDVSGKDTVDTIVDANGNILQDMSFSIQNVWVDGIMLELWALPDIFWLCPIYSQSAIDYMTERNISISNKLTGDYKFFNNGTLIFDNENFYEKYNHTMISAFDQKWNTWVRQTHLGAVDESKIEQLKQMLEELQ